MKNRLTYPLLFLFTLSFLMSCSNEDVMEYDYNDSVFDPQLTGEQYNSYVDNPFVDVAEEPVSTFSIDADGASYANVRRFINVGAVPPVDAIRIEELINYFNFNYPEPSGEHPVALNGEVAACPWTEGHKLIRIGIKGKTIPDSELPASNMVLLIDVSGSMESENKLELLKAGFNLLVDKMSANDRIAIVTYAGESKVVLPSTSGAQKNTIKEAINQLGAGGGTAGAQGVITAYEIAQENFIEGGNNRIIVGSDGDFNIGPSSQDELIELIKTKRDLGIFLTVLGVGTGNLNEAMMEQLANNGNGNYEYIDNITQARKVFVNEFKKFHTVAQDCKVQIEFNPEMVSAYRLIGYENRMLEQSDFTNDEEDAGEIGSSQTITALYEIVPARNSAQRAVAFSIDFRYKLPGESTSIPMALDIVDSQQDFEQASENLRFASAVASFGMLLRDSEYKGNTSYQQIKAWANAARSYDLYGLRYEFLSLIDTMNQLQ